MIRVPVLCPTNGSDAFDMNYYVEKHLPVISFAYPARSAQ